MTKEIKLLHLKHGHVPFPRLKLLHPHLATSNIKECLICTICPLACQGLLPFTHSEIKSTKPFELLHLDLWGPYVKATHNGCNMFLTIVDDFTRTT